MKSIELTEEHRFKLIEMCNKLFPEFISCEWYEDGDGYDDYDILVFKNIKPPYLLIHWFEFCIFHLQKELLLIAIKQDNDKILYKINHSNWLDECLHRIWEVRELYKNTDGSMGFKHPIDYLYELFKELKL